jgi:hypothetical protein
MKLDLKGFHKISKDGNMTKLRHPEGHEITINHSILSPKMRGEIEALPHINKDKTPDSKQIPHFDNGGDVSDSSSPKLGQLAATKTTPPSSGGGSDSSGSGDSSNPLSSVVKLAALLSEGGSPKDPNRKQISNSNSIPKFADGSESDDVSLPEKIINMGKKAFSSPTPAPTPSPLDDRYSKIREQNRTNMSGETSPIDQKYYAEGTPDEPVKKDIGIDLSQDPKELQIAPKEQTQDEKDIAKAKSDYDTQNSPDSDVSSLKNLQNLGSSPSQEQPADPAQSMLDAHSDAMEAHNTAMKLFANAQPQSAANSQSQPASSPSTPQNQQAPAQSASPQTQQAPDQSDQSQPQDQGQPQAGPLPDYQSKVNEADKQAAQMKAYSDKQETANAELGKNVLEGKINPQRLYQNMGTGGKIANIIGLILGGIGGGASGKNMASEALQKAVENDVDAQKADQTNNMNLYKLNLEATKNNIESRNLSVNQLLSSAQAQIAKRAADTTNQNGQLEAQKVIQDIQAKKMENMSNAYKFKMIQDLSTGPQASNLPPGQVDLDKFNKYKLAGVMPKEDSEAATKEANAYQEKVQLQKDMDQSAAHLNKQLGAGALTPSDRQSAINAFAGRIAKLGEGRFNLEEAKLQAQALLPSPLDAPSTSRNKDQRRAAFFDSIAQTPTLDRYRLVSHAPASSTIKKMNGVSYQLGPDGNYHKLGK